MAKILRYIAGLLLCLGFQSSANAYTGTLVPAQFIAKQYSEALGRIPDPGGWTAAIGYFQQNGCSTATLKTWGSSVFASTEFQSLGYTPEEQVRLVYRAVLNREADNGGLYFYAGQLRSGALTLNQYVQIAYNSAEFGRLSPYICRALSYGYGSIGTDSTFVPTSLPQAAAPGTPNAFQQISQSTVQSWLEAAKSSGGTVVLPQDSFVILDEPLVIPAGVTLTTAGSPDRYHHGKMARLIRGRNFPSGNGMTGDELIKICPDLPFIITYSTQQTYTCQGATRGGSITNLWVDGERSALGDDGNIIQFRRDDVDIHVWSGSGISVSDNFLSNSAGWSTAFFWGYHEQDSTVPCGTRGTVQVANNLVTAYPSKHQFLNQPPQYTDGLTLSCEQASITNNHIIDTTDVAIVIARACPAAQHSVASDNQILSAGNSAPAAMSLDPLFPTPQDSCTPGNPDATAYQPSFAGASFENNHFWTGPNTHYVIGQAVGSAAWFMSSTYGAYTGTGGNVTGNDNNNIPTNEGTAILVAGINNARVQSNLGNRVPVSTTCSAVAGDVVVADNVASGNDVQLHSDVYLAGTCLGESNSAPGLVWPGA